MFIKKRAEVFVVLSAVELCKGGREEMSIRFSWGNSWQAVLNESRRREYLSAGS
jgi:hypothetical protein